MVRLFVDGRLQAATEWQGPYKESSVPFWIGADPCPEAGRTSPLYRAFNGLIAELRVSSIAKYESDFAPAMRLKKDNATILLYPFDEGAGEKIYDHSGFHRFGEVHNIQWAPRQETDR